MAMEFDQITKLIFYLALLIVLVLLVGQITGKQTTIIDMLKGIITFG